MAWPIDPELLLSTALKRTKAPQPESSASSANTGGGKHWSQVGTQDQVQAQPPSLKNSQARQSPGQKSDLPGRGLQSLRYLSHKGEHKKQNLQEAPVSLNNAATTQDKGTALPLKLL